MNAVSRVKWRQVWILATPIVQTLLAALPPKYFFSLLPSSPLPSPPVLFSPLPSPSSLPFPSFDF